jgi:hypothetical protein
MLATAEEVVKLISKGKQLVLAADERLLSSLPMGNWIGGTIPYFMTDDGGKVSRDRLFVNEMPTFANSCRTAVYDESRLPEIVSDSPDNGFSVVILPAFSKVHQSYALNAASYEGLFLKPVVGWVAGIHLDDFSSASPQIFNGSTGETSGNKAVAIHVELPPAYRSAIKTVNIFDQGSGDVISFPGDGFQVLDCFVNGEKRNFHDYLIEKKIDTRLPLVSDFCGTMINVSIQSLIPAEKAVQFYAPIFETVEYRIANPVEDYAASFYKAVPGNVHSPAFACNCILNFLYGELEGKKTGSITGPMTFGEIAYQLLNQTMVFIEVEKIG